jgi:hypothetical protein
MTVRVNKPSFNIREKLSELGRKFGLKGSELAAAETVQEARDLVNAGRKNKVINGAMQFAQRTTSDSGISSSNTVRVLDRYQVRVNSIGTWTVEQSTQSPPGFANSMRWQCTTADTSPGASDFIYMAHRFEGKNVQDLAKGTSSAKPVTVSFWVRSTVTGSYSFRLVDNQNNRQIGQNYTVNQSDTWEYKTMTFDGDMTGALNNDSGNRLSMMWWLAVGSNRTSGSIPTSWETMTTADEAAGQTANIASSTSNNFFITGIQLEVGNNATEFEHRSYGEELALCQRYFFKLSNSRLIMGYKRHDGSSNFPVNTPVSMRAAPTPTLTTSGTFSNFQSAFSTTQSSPNVYEWSESGNRFIFQVQSTWSSTHTYVPAWESFTAEFDSEF